MTFGQSLELVQGGCYHRPETGAMVLEGLEQPLERMQRSFRASDVLFLASRTDCRFVPMLRQWTRRTRGNIVWTSRETTSNFRKKAWYLRCVHERGRRGGGVGEPQTFTVACPRR